MNSIVAVLTQNILPIFIMAAFGYGLQRWKAIDKKALSTAVLYVFSPSLVFSSLVNSQLPGKEMARLVLFSVVVILTMGLLAWTVAKALRLSRSQTAALLIVVMFVNGGNYGLTLNKLRYGDTGLSWAIVYYITSTIMVYTIGMFIASAGQLNWRQSLRKLSTLPPVYAVVFAIVIYTFDLTVPAPLMRGIEVGGAGAIPVMLLVLGMQMADLNGRARWRLTIPAVGLRLLIAPVVAVLVAAVVGISGLPRSVAIIEASMPTAVIAIVVATEFDLEGTAVTSIVAISTLLSPLTVALVITLLGL